MNSLKADNCLQIITLGRFEVRRNEQVLSQDSTRSNRVWELFKYLVSNRHKGIVPEIALENLWPEQEYADPRGAIRALIFRLRKLLGPSPTGQEYIQFSQGCYRWNSEVDYWLDIEEFEQKARQASEIKSDNPMKAAEILQEAISLYQGEYLPESYYSQWTIPIRNYYHTLYLQVVLDFIALLEAHNEHSKMINICEQALLTHPYEEDLHKYYLQALLREGRVKQAQNHHAYIKHKFYQDLGLKLSPELDNILPITDSQEKNSLDLNGVQERLKGNKDEIGAFVCTSEVFREIYQLERRRGERIGISVFVALVTIIPSYVSRSSSSTKGTMDGLELFLVNSLRKGDVIARWSNNQYVLMLPGLAYEQGEKVMERIKNGFNNNNRAISMHTEIQPVLPPEIYS